MPAMTRSSESSEAGDGQQPLAGGVLALDEVGEVGDGGPPEDGDAVGAGTANGNGDHDAAFLARGRYRR
jgi:hypothetical protein